MPTQEIIKLYKAGVSATELSLKYVCTPKKILDILRENGIEIRKANQYNTVKTVTEIKPKGKYDHIIFDKVNQGKTYAEYLSKGV